MHSKGLLLRIHPWIEPRSVYHPENNSTGKSNIADQLLWKTGAVENITSHKVVRKFCPYLKRSLVEIPSILMQMPDSDIAKAFT